MLQIEGPERKVTVDPDPMSFGRQRRRRDDGHQRQHHGRRRRIIGLHITARIGVWELTIECGGGACFETARERRDLAGLIAAIVDHDTRRDDARQPRSGEQHQHLTGDGLAQTTMNAPHSFKINKRCANSLDLYQQKSRKLTFESTASPYPRGKPPLWEARTRHHRSHLAPVADPHGDPASNKDPAGQPNTAAGVEAGGADGGRVAGFQNR